MKWLPRSLGWVAKGRGLVDPKLHIAQCLTPTPRLFAFRCCSTSSSDAFRAPLSNAYSSEPTGDLGTIDFRRYCTDTKGSRLSFWHDVPLRTSAHFRAIVEITRMTRAKMEIDTTEFMSPIKQDTKNGILRDYAMPIRWNYGAIPQTWEQPDHEWPGLEGHRGDNDPVDIVDISPQPVACGSVIEFKPVAALAMIDEAECATPHASHASARCPGHPLSLPTPPASLQGRLEGRGHQHSGLAGSGHQQHRGLRARLSGRDRCHSQVVHVV